MLKYIETPILKEYLNTLLFEKQIRKLTPREILELFDIDNIPYAERKAQHIDFSYIIKYMGFSLPLMINEDNTTILSEETEYTKPVNEIKESVINYFNFKNWQIKTFHEKNGANNIKIAYLMADCSMNIQLTKVLMESYGWSISTYGYYTDIDGLKWVVLSFDPIYQTDITNEVKMYHAIYHWSPLYNKENIIHFGLTPKSNNSRFMYPNRLHFIKGDTSHSELYNIGKQLCNSNKITTNNGNYVLFEVNPKNLPNDIIFYYDPRYECGIYTKQIISPQFIKVIGEINFNTDKEITFFNN